MAMSKGIEQGVMRSGKKKKVLTRATSIVSACVLGEKGERIDLTAAFLDRAHLRTIEVSDQCICACARVFTTSA